MQQKYINQVQISFNYLIADHGFLKGGEVNSGDIYFSVYESLSFCVKVEKYRKDFYITLFRPAMPELEIELFNLLSFLSRKGEKTLKSISRDKGKDPIRKQVTTLAGTLLSNLEIIRLFFMDSSFEERVDELRSELIKMNPDLFKRGD